MGLPLDTVIRDGSADYDLPGWDAMQWSRGRNTYGSTKTTAEECIWYSPGCLPATGKQVSMFGGDS